MSAIEKNSGKSWLQFIVVFLAGITIAMGMFKVPVNMPNIMEYYGADMTQVSLLMSVVGITCLITALPAGGVMQKVGVKKFGVIVIACGILENLIGAFAPNIQVLIASRLLDAVSYGCLSMVSVAIIAANFTPEKRGLPNGIWVIWVSFAQLIIAQLANTVVPAFGWQGEWIAVAVFQAVALVLFILFIKSPGSDDAGQDAENPKRRYRFSKASRNLDPGCSRFALQVLPLAHPSTPGCILPTCLLRRAAASIPLPPTTLSPSDRSAASSAAL